MTALAIYAIPLWHMGTAFDLYGAPKFLVGAFLAFLASLPGIQGKEGDAGNPGINIALLACGLALITATILSHNPAVSAMGQQRVYTSGLFPMVLVAGWFLLAQSERYEAISRHIINAALISTAWAFIQAFGCLAPTPLSDGRPYAGIGSPVYLASFLALAFPLAVERGSRLSAVVLFLGIVLTETRSALLAAVLGALVSLRHHRPTKAQVLSALAVVCLGLIAINRSRTDMLQADHGRIIVYKTAWRVIKQNPWFGYGPDLFSDAFKKNRNAEWTDAGFSLNSSQGTAHNDILQALAGGGIFWALAYLAFCVVLARALWSSGNIGALGAAASLFAYAKLNEVGLPVKLVFFILAGSALGGVRSYSWFLTSSLFVVMFAAFYMVMSDRVFLWYRLIDSPGLMNLGNRMFAIYG